MKNKGSGTHEEILTRLVQIIQMLNDRIFVFWSETKVSPQFRHGSWFCQRSHGLVNLFKKPREQEHQYLESHFKRRRNILYEATDPLERGDGRSSISGLSNLTTASLSIWSFSPFNTIQYSEVSSLIRRCRLWLTDVCIISYTQSNIDWDLQEGIVTVVKPRSWHWQSG